MYSGTGMGLKRSRSGGVCIYRRPGLDVCSTGVVLDQGGTGPGKGWAFEGAKDRLGQRALILEEGEGVLLLLGSVRLGGCRYYWIV